MTNLPTLCEIGFGSSEFDLKKVPYRSSLDVVKHGGSTQNVNLMKNISSQEAKPAVGLSPRDRMKSELELRRFKSDLSLNDLGYHANCQVQNLPRTALNIRDGSNGLSYDSLMSLFKLERARTAPAFPLNIPKELPIIQISDDYNLPLDEEKLKWIDKLNCWMPEKGLENPVPYLSFINSANLHDRGIIQFHDERDGDDVIPCSRFLEHMQMHTAAELAQKLKEKRRLAEQKRRDNVKQFDLRKALRKRMNLNPANTPPSTRRARRKKVQPPKSDTMTRSPVPTNLSPWTNVTDESSGIRGDGDGDRKSDDGSMLSESLKEIEITPKASTPPPSQLEVHEGPLLAKTANSPLHWTDRTENDENIKMSSFLANIPPSRPSTRSSETRPIKSASTSLPTVQPSESVKLKLDVSTKNNKKIKSDPSFVPRPPREERIRWRETPKKKQTPPEQIKRRPSHIIKKKKSAILDDYEFVRAEDTPVPEPIQEEVVLETPKLPSPPKTPTPPPKTPAESPALPKIVISLKNLWGPKQKDRSYWDELRRMREAEERRKQLLIRQRLNRRRPGDVMDLSGGPEIQEELEMPEDPDGWLAKYCIFNRDDLEMFKCAFEAVDEDNTGYLDGFDISIAIRGVNPKLTGFEEEYIYRILEMVGYNIEMGSGADFKLFAVMAAMSQRIAALDDWMRGLIGKINFKSLEHKMYMCKTLWECNVDHDTNRISIDQLCVELRAGGVSLKHEHEVREKLGHLKSLDLMDFLTYMPLFLMIHKSVTANPLDDSRIK